MSDRVEIPVPRRHTDDSFPSDWMAVRVNGEVTVINEPADDATTVYTLGDTTTNPRVVAAADALIWDGIVAIPHYQNGEVVLQHKFAGVRDRLLVDEFLDEPVQLLERTELITLVGAGGTVEFDCLDCGEHIQRDRHQMDLPGVTPQRCVSCKAERMGESP